MLSGLGMGIIASTYSIYKLENRLALSTRITTSSEKKYCRYCGVENKKGTVFCEKCGKQIL